MKSKEERLKELTPIQYDVTQNSATEPSFTGEYDSFNEVGLYVDIVGGEPLFTSIDAFWAVWLTGIYKTCQRRCSGRNEW